MKRFFVQVTFLFICFQSSNVTAQNAGEGIANLPNLIPPSPELASLASIANINAQGYTGCANVSIPVYEVKAGSLSLPISLNYSSNGIRVNDIPSRVGLGWNLVSGGSVTRIIHDEDDYHPNTIKLAPPSSFAFPPTFDANAPLVQYLMQASMDYRDTEDDEFAFNINGISGKFFIDDQGVCRLSNQGGMKMEQFLNSSYGSNIGTFILTTANGTKYYFGQETEQSTDAKINNLDRSPSPKTTGWLIQKIVSPEGDCIAFNYESIHTKAFMGPTQSVSLLKKLPPYSNYGTCNACGQGSIGSIYYNKVEYDTKYLSSIYTSNKTFVYFFYQSRGDESGDVRLTQVKVGYTNEDGNSKISKRFVLDYSDYPNANDDYKRFYLTKLLQFPGEGEVTQSVMASSPIHSFEYESPEMMPSHKSLKQDYFGFFNGDLNNTNQFFPKPENYNDYHYADLGANRNPSFEHSKIGSLKKVIFPTGGFKEFVYEPNTLKKELTQTTYSNLQLNTCGSGLNSPVVVNKYFSVTTSHSGQKLTFNSFLCGWGPQPGQPNYWEAGDGKIIAILRIYTNTTNPILKFTASKTECTNQEFNLDLNNGEYRIELTVKGSTYSADAFLQYNPTNSSTWVNKPVCGIRVKQINAFDPVSNKTIGTYYKYCSIEDLATAIGIQYQYSTHSTNSSLGIPISSGVGLEKTVNQSLSLNGSACTIQTQNIYIPVLEICQNILTISSSGISGAHLFGSSPVAYAKIIESDDPNFLNGGIEHTYNIDFELNNVLPILNTPPVGFMGFKSNIDGSEISTKYFKQSSNGFLLSKEQESIFTAHQEGHYEKRAYITGNRWAMPPNNWVTWGGISGSDEGVTISGYQAMLRGFDIGEYVYRTGWLTLSNQITRTYDEFGRNPIEEIVSYTHDNIEHGQQTKISYTNSKREQVIKEIHYPTDVNQQPYIEMVNAHILSPVLEQITSVSTNGNSVITSKEKILYSGFDRPNGPSFFKPHTIQKAKGNNTYYDVASFRSYDSKTNISKLNKIDGTSCAYEWGYLSQLLVAEVIDERLNGYAITGFETHTPNDWGFIDANLKTEGFTGNRSYSGTLTTIIDRDLVYRLTLWSKTTPLVNTLAGNLLRSVRGWNLYEWKIQQVGTVKIEGDWMDEIRLTSYDAIVTSYTYEPLRGVSTVCDNNNDVLYYEYDPFGRLICIRDTKFNIVKLYDYKYKQSITPPSNTTPMWQPTGLKKCFQTGQNGNYTGEQLAEERDQNNASNTYLQTRWVSLGNTGLCNTIIGCEEDNERVVNGICERGVKVLVNSQYNPSGSIWICSYVYEWSDGYISNPFPQTSLTECIFLQVY